MPVPGGRSNNRSPSGVGKAYFDAVSSRIISDQPYVGDERERTGSTNRHGAGSDYFLEFGKVLHGIAREHRHVVRTGVIIRRLVETVSIDEMAVLKPEGRQILVHQIDKRRLAPGDIVGEIRVALGRISGAP